jgi:crossover junction endodeoxyribonuclease RusA
VTAFLAMVVPGQPTPKARPRLGANGHVYTPRETQQAEGAVGWIARAKLRGQKPATGPLSVTVAFHVRDRRRRDVDNLLKTVLDGLNGIAWIDDSQVVHADVWLILDRANPHTDITVSQLPGVPHALPASTA